MILKFVLIGVAFIMALIAYGAVLKTYLSTTASATDKSTSVATSSGLDKVWAALMYWKTLICTWIATAGGLLVAIPSETLQAWSGLPWSGFVDQKAASVITIVFGLLAGIFHTQEAATAAKTAPQD